MWPVYLKAVNEEFSAKLSKPELRTLGSLPGRL